MSFSHSKQTWAEQTNLDIAIAHCLSEVSPHTFRKATFFFNPVCLANVVLNHRFSDEI
jgi:hypothetical protein